MSSHRLRIQFETLFEYCKGLDTDIKLEEITDVLFCTRRNARIVLNKMEEQGWIDWAPSAGRGKLSHLTFKRSRTDVSENLARRYLEEGKIDQALHVLDHDATKLTQVIQHFLGVQHQQGEQVVRLPYYRPLSMLNPLKNMRRSEQHIVRQVFSGLTRLDEHEHVMPDLAHSWSVISSTHWRFYLRPCVRFHNGDLLTEDGVIESLQSLNVFPLFSHIDRVTSPCRSVIDIYLTSPDMRLDLTLTESCAKILLPSGHRNNDYDLMPVGTGPYKVISNDDKRLILQAFDGYYGFRPLLDRVEVCVIDESHSSLVFPSLAHPIATSRGSLTEDVKLDPGCIYLLLNRKGGLASDEPWANYFCAKLHSLNIFRQLSDHVVGELGLLPAHGIKPGWYHNNAQHPQVEPPENKTVSIAYYAKHPMFPYLAKAIEKIMKADGIRCHLIKYEHDSGAPDHVDILIKAMSISTYRDDAIAGWLLNYSELYRYSKRAHFAEWTTLVDNWRCDVSLSFPATEIGKSLIQNKQIIPAFHVWMGVNKEQCGSLQNAQCNALGWFDFSNVWVKPALE